MRTMLLIGLLASVPALAQSDTDASTHQLPVREVTVFKDGHAMVYREGTLPTNDHGHVVLDDLPQPVLGTFWAFENQRDAELRAVRAGTVDATVERPVQAINDLLAMAIDQRIAWQWGSSLSTGTVKALLPSPATAQLVLIEHDSGGLEALPIGSLNNVRFLDGIDPNASVRYQLPENRLSLELAWQGAVPSTAEVGVMYIQKGIRWIPSYRVTLLDDNTARIELQAALINDLIPLDDATVHLVVGVPRFEFGHTPDPIALNDQFAQLGQYFQRQDGTAGAFSNALMAQGRRMQEVAPQGQSNSGGGATPPELTGSDRTEDLYVFSIDHVTLDRGERMILPISTAEVPVEAVYKLTLPAAPPSAAWSNFNTEQQKQIADALNAPLARHVLRLTNTSDHPFTTAPALIVRNGRPLAQGLMTYTARSGKTDLEVTDAVDIKVNTDEQEAARTDNAIEWSGNAYARIDFTSTIELTNHKPHAVKVEITKLTFGLPTDASDDGEAAALGMFQDSSLWSGEQWNWWRYYGWPWWWHRLNGVSRFKWTVELQPGETTNRTATWHYFWR